MSFLLNVVLAITIAFFANAQEHLDIRDFEWSKCDDRKYLIDVEDLDLTMDGNKVVSRGKIHVGEELQKPLKIETSLEKSVLGKWVRIKCYNGTTGSCIFDDVCTKFGLQKEEPCPPELEQIGLPCRCPIPMRTYEFKDEQELGKVPKVLKGKYRSKTIATKNGEIIGCYEFNFRLA